MFATDAEGLNVVDYVSTHSEHGLDAIDYVNLMMYDIDAKEAFRDATEPWFVQAHYDAVVEATASSVGLAKTVIGFEPRVPCIHRGVGRNGERQDLNPAHFQPWRRRCYVVGNE